MRPSLICCETKLTTKKQVLAHFKQVPFTDRRNVFGCILHGYRWKEVCKFCQAACWVNAISKSLWPKGLMLSDSVDHD